ncbi:ARMC1 [Bugula neritina]|uniref:ARMC1 n=1 Tax=Bugula neritina TaxID=10212 RepID=A0A7J7K0N5_BUGNE|nr:ARMC1 [Bugula neritina]
MLSSEGLDQLTAALKDPVKRKLIARDDTLIGGLVLVLSNADKKVVIEALEILLCLAMPVEHREFLHNFMGMKEQLTLLAKDTNPLDHVRELSSQLLCRLSSTEPVPFVPPQPLQQLRSRNANTDMNRAQRAGKTFNKPFLNATKFKTITLQIDGLHDKVRADAAPLVRQRLIL